MGGVVQLLVGSLMCSNQGRVSLLYQPGVSMVRQFQGVQGTYTLSPRSSTTMPKRSWASNLYLERELQRASCLYFKYSNSLKQPYWKEINFLINKPINSSCSLKNKICPSHSNITPPKFLTALYNPSSVSAEHVGLVLPERATYLEHSLYSSLTGKGQ